MILPDSLQAGFVTTLFYSHPDFLEHDTGFGHPECAARLTSIDKALQATHFTALVRPTAPLGDREQIGLIHTSAYIDAVFNAVPQHDLYYLDADTVISKGSGVAALRAVGAVCNAVDKLLGGTADNAFCAVRPPGHHAEADRAMGFCLFNNIAIAAAYARQTYQLQRIAIVDFDVHHGNGTQQAFWSQAGVLYTSSHQMPFYPGTGFAEETGAGNIINVPLGAGTRGPEFRNKYRQFIFPALNRFKPQLLLLSAGFDAHRDDPLASIMLTEDDYQWLTEELTAIADQHCQGKILSILEGGYNLHALAASVAVHVAALLNA